MTSLPPDAWAIEPESPRLLAASGRSSCGCAFTRNAGGQSIAYCQPTNHIRESAHRGRHVAVAGVIQAESRIRGSPVAQDLDQSPLGKRFSCVPFTDVRKPGALQGGAQNQAVAVEGEWTSDIYT